MVEVLVQRDPAGVSPLLETRIIEASVIKLRREANEATKEAQNALFELNKLRGQSLAAPLTLAKTSLDFPATMTVEQLLSLARVNNYDLRMRQVELAQQGLKVALSENERWPGFELGPSITQEKAIETEKTVGVGLSLPLPLWNHNAGNIQTAQARQNQAETSLLLTQRDIERELRERVLAYEAQRKEIGRWTPNIVQQLREAAELADRHYRLGALPVATYIEVQEKYLEALGAILATQADALENRQQIDLLTGVAMQGERAITLQRNEARVGKTNSTKGKKQEDPK